MIMGKDKKASGGGGDKKTDKSAAAAGKKSGDAAGGSGKVKAAQQINVRHILVYLGLYLQNLSLSHLFRHLIST